MNKKVDLKTSKTVDGDQIYIPVDVWDGTPSHPQCPFFELHPENYAADMNKEYTVMQCHLDGNYQVCKGDYCKCPLYGKYAALRSAEAEMKSLLAEAANGTAKDWKDWLRRVCKVVNNA